MNILAIDVGTTSMRGLLFREDGELLFSASRATPLLRAGAFVEQSPILLRSCLIEICRTIVENAGSTVDALSLTTFRSAPALMQENGEALCNFIMWQDTRNKEICEELRDICKDLPARCGAVLSTIHTATKLTWLCRNRPELYHRADRIAVVPDYLLHYITGEWITDYTYASRALLL